VFNGNPEKAEHEESSATEESGQKTGYDAAAWRDWRLSEIRIVSKKKVGMLTSRSERGRTRAR